MFDSGISAKSLIDEIKNEADIAPDIPNKMYYSWLNTLEQVLYSEVIKEQKEATIEITDTEGFNGTIPLDSFNASGEDEVRFEDIHAVFADGCQLILTTLTSGSIFPNCYFKKEDCCYISTDFAFNSIKVIYFVRPALKEIESDVSIKLPFEFLDLARSYIRSEAYKIANEDELCAKWTNEYNVLLESFRVWISSKSPSFGI